MDTPPQSRAQPHRKQIRIQDTGFLAANDLLAVGPEIGLNTTCWPMWLTTYHRWRQTLQGVQLLGLRGCQVANLPYQQPGKSLEIIPYFLFALRSCWGSQGNAHKRLKGPLPFLASIVGVWVLISTHLICRGGLPQSIK